MPSEKAAGDAKRWRSVMPRCKGHNTALDILDIYFSSEREATRIDVGCPACNERFGLIYLTAGCIVLVSRMRAEEADAEEWRALPSLHCENCTRELIVQDICVSGDGDLLFEYKCFACGKDKIYDHEFSRKERISWAVAVYARAKTKKPVLDETWRERPVSTDGGGRINVALARPT